MNCKNIGEMVVLYEKPPFFSYHMDPYHRTPCFLFAGAVLCLFIESPPRSTKECDLMIVCSREVYSRTDSRVDSRVDLSRCKS